ncbi:MAG: ABC transporter permease [Propionibacterium sp.]|nr:ABC transporter permease [Propionibacterium sp.]
MTVEPTWHLAIALVLLLALAVTASVVARLGVHRTMVLAAVRAILQLGIVSFIIVAAVTHLGYAIAFAVLMFAIGVRTTAQRTGVGRAWPWSALAMACGVVPVLLIVFGSGTAPLNGMALVPLAGIVIGNMMTAHTLVGRREFAALRDGVATYEAALAIGLPRPEAIRLTTETSLPEALYPNLDATRTVGLVTLPGAFIGVLLGGGSPLQAGAAQVLVLIGIMAGQAVVVGVAHRLMMAGRLMPADLRARLRP